MLNLIAIIALLFAALLIIVPLLEKYGPEPSAEKLQRLNRWITPLVTLAIILQAIKFWLG